MSLTALSRLSRFAPAAVVLGLFTLVAATKPPAAPQMPFPIATPCQQYSQASGGASTAQFSSGDGVTQPVLDGEPIYACSLHVAATGWSSAELKVREWDPLTLAPDPSTIALRTAHLDPSRLNYYYTNSVPWVLMSPPLILKSVPGVAEPPRETVAIEVLSGSLFNAYYEPQGDAGLAEAQNVSAGGAHQPLSGDHPVLGHAICDGGTAFADLRIAQSVKRTDAVLATHPFEILQRFRVTEPIELRWVELAVNAGVDPGVANASVGEQMPVQPNGVISVVDATFFDEPPAQMPSPLVEALFEPYYNFYGYLYQPPPRWGTHYEFDHPVTLYPDHDYWVHMRLANTYELFVRNSAGPESPAFTAGIGTLHTKQTSDGDWAPVENQALAFKIIGRPTAPVGVSPPRPSAPFRLAVAPNPASALAQVTWSGAVGPVKLEVLDERGRRVARGEGGAAGSWALPATARDGRPLAAGVYFVHARDSAGQLMIERLVIVR